MADPTPESVRKLFFKYSKNFIKNLNFVQSSFQNTSKPSNTAILRSSKIFLSSFVKAPT